MKVRRLREDELQHFGVLGMKWGVRRYQNEDGSLTSEGKARYIKGDLDSGYVSLTNAGKKEYSKTLTKNRKLVEQEAASELKNYQSKLTEESNKLNDNANSYAKQIEEKTKSLAKSDSFKKDVYNTYNKNNGFNEWDMVDAIHECLTKEIGKDQKMIDTFNEYMTAQDAYWDTLKEVTKKVTSKVGNNIMTNSKNMPFVAQGENAVGNIVRGMEKDSKWNSYVYRHFDDYWVAEAVSPDLTKNITVEDYEKYSKKE